MHALGPCGSLQQTFLRGWEFLLLPPPPLQVFSMKGLRLYFPTLEPWVAVCFAPPLFLPVYLCANVGMQGLTATTLWGLLAAAWPAPFYNPPPHWVCQPPPCRKSSTLAAGLHPAYWSGGMFLLYLLGCWTSIQFDFLSVLVVFCF